MEELIRADEKLVENFETYFEIYIGTGQVF